MARRTARTQLGTALWGALIAACALVSCGRREPAVVASRPEALSRAVAASPAEAIADLEPGSSDLLPLLRQGAIDAAGPVVDFGEPQAAAYVLAPQPLGSETVNGDSWAAVGSRVRVRVPISLDHPPTELRIRVRRPHARRVVAIVDGLLARQAALPTGPLPTVIVLPVLPDRFRRDTAEVELRFLGGPRAVTVAQPRVSRVVRVVRAGRRGVRVVRRAAPAVPPAPPASRRARVRPPPPPPPPAAVELDWLHLASESTPTVRASDLLADVRLHGPPRRALTLYAPTTLVAVTVVPPQGTLRAALSAEGVRGGTDAPPPVTAHLRVEVDGVSPVELVREVPAEAPWQEVSLDLGPLAGRPARISVSAEGRPETRLAVAEPRIVARTPAVAPPPPPVRHALLVVVRGARLDRFVPTMSTRFTAGGFARLARDSLVARAVAAAPRDLAALASAVTGLPAEVHRFAELTDTLDEQAPTLAAQLREAGVATAGFADDQWFAGSGLDLALTEHGGCAADAGFCRAEPVLSQAGDWLVRHREVRSFAMVVLRGGAPALDPPPDILQTLDPNPYEGSLSPEMAAHLAQRSHRGPVVLEQRVQDRLAAMYDAALAGIDRGLATLLDRLRDAGMLNDTAIVFVGDRGTALGESGLVGDGPMSLGVISQTVLMARTPGVSARQLEEPASVLDAAATVLERLGVRPFAVDPGARAGAASVFVAPGGVLHGRGVVFVGGARNELGLALGGLVALPRSAGLALYAPEDDALGQTDVSALRPIARAYAESVLTAYRQPLPDEPSARVLEASTRPLPLVVETAYQHAGILRR